MPYKPSAEKPISQFIAYCRATCCGGFDNHWHHKNWLIKYRKEIDLLNEFDRAVILALHANSSWNHSERKRAATRSVAPKASP